MYQALKGSSVRSAVRHMGHVPYEEEIARGEEGASSELATRVGVVATGWADAAFGLYVNRRPVNVERPSFNVFQLLEDLSAEGGRLRELELRVRPRMLRDAYGSLAW